MAAACSSEETESFITCGICFCEYDAEIRKPKILPCAHTLCLTCLKKIHKDGTINCPFCRKSFSHKGDVTSLPNNIYALHMMLNCRKWCLTCGAKAKNNCQLVHSTFKMTTKTIMECESLLKLRKEIKKMKDEGQTTLALAIEKRKEIQAHLAQVSHSLKLALGEVNQQEKTNNAQLAVMISEMEGINPLLEPHQAAADEDKEDPILMELVSMAHHSGLANPNNKTLREKMANSMQSYKEKLAVATEMATDLTNQKKSRISVRVVDSKNQTIPTCEMLNDGHDTYWPGETNLTQTKRDSLLLSHIVYSMKKRGENVHQEDTRLLDGPTKQFVITVRHWEAVKGRITLSLRSDLPFIQQLYEKCFRSPENLSSMIGKDTRHGVFVQIPANQMEEVSFKELGRMPPARLVKEVGVSLKGRTWSFLFPLHHFLDKSNAFQKESVGTVYYIGYITKGLEIIDMLSETQNHQRDKFSFTLESK